jgi:hypothetical protein
MEYNPLRAQVTQLEIEIEHLNVKIRAHVDQLESWQAFDLAAQQISWEKASLKIAEMEKALLDLDGEKASLPPKPSNVKTVGLVAGATVLALATGGVAIWTALGIEVVAAGVGGAAALSGGAIWTSGFKGRRQHKDLAKRCAKLQSERAVIKSQAEKIHTQIELHKAVDPIYLGTQIEELFGQRFNLSEKLRPISGRCAQVDERIAPFVVQISELERDLLILERELMQADQIASALDSAPSPRARALLHRQCESIFDEGNPGHVRRRLQKESESKGRTLKKLQSQVKEKSTLAVLAIDRVVLDGSNLCYRFDSEFIGLIALRPAIKALLDARFKIVVVFDRSIFGKLKMTREEVREALDARASIHFMASKLSADETLLREAEPQHSAVISRDRFRDFKHMLVVKEERVFDQNIMESRIEIPALDINVPFVT